MDGILMPAWNWLSDVRSRAARTVPLLALLIIAGTGGTAAGGAPALGGEPGFAVSVDRAHLRDAQAHLLWPRCVAGTDWKDDHCVGHPLRLTQAEADIFAHEYARESGRRYRLPTVLELRRLSELAHADPQGSALLTSLLAGGEWLWTSTPQFTDQAVNPYRYDNVMKAHEAALMPPAAVPVPRAWAASLRTGAARSNFSRAATLPVVLVLGDGKDN
jgi:hypothetical protein